MVWNGTDGLSREFWSTHDSPECVDYSKAKTNLFPYPSGNSFVENRVLLMLKFYCIIILKSLN